MTTYIQEAIRTESQQFNPARPRLLHAALGIVTEIMEYFDNEDEINAKEELGDVYWYVAIAADELGMTFDEIKASHDGVGTTYSAIGGLCDVVKRANFYGVPFDTETFTQWLGLTLHWMERICVYENVTPEECMAANIAKLSARFPDKFTTVNAVNRDKDAEIEAVKTSR
jgi:hypothetical protein